MLKFIHIIFIMICLHGAANAQFAYEEVRKHINFSTGYLGIIDLPSDYSKFHSGMRFSVSPSLANKYMVREQKKTAYNRIIDRNIFLNAHVSYYKREDLHHALMIQAGPAFRITLPEGIFFEFEGSVGYMRTFLAGDHFSYDGSTITESRALGDDLFILQAETSVGWDFYKSNQYPVFLFASAGLMTYFPNNDNWIYQPTFRAGLGFVLMRIEESY